MVVGELGELGEGLVGDDPAELIDEAEALEAGDELVGSDETVLGVLPANERFESHDVAAVDVDLGLEVHDELIGFDGVFEIDVGRGEGLGGQGEGDGEFGGGVGLEQALQLAEPEWLVEVADDGETVGRTELFGGLDDTFSDSAHEDDIDSALLLAEEAEELDSVDLGHEEIKQDEAGVGGERGEEGRGVGGVFAGEAHAAGGGGYDFSDVVVVVDDEDLVGGCHLNLQAGEEYG